MKNIEANIKRYVSAWNEPTAETVKAALEECCSPEITYTDKNTPIFKGIDQLVSLIMGSYETFPGRTFSILTEPECFEGNCYYTWGGNLPGKGDVVGHDFIEYDENLLITRIVGFLPVA